MLVASAIGVLVGIIIGFIMACYFAQYRLKRPLIALYDEVIKLSKNRRAIIILNNIRKIVQV